MKTLVIGAGPLGSLYACLLHQAGKDITILARNEHYTFISDNGLVLINEFTQEKTVEKIRVINHLEMKDTYDLAIVLMRKNSVRQILPVISKHQNIQNFLLNKFRSCICCHVQEVSVEFQARNDRDRLSRQYTFAVIFGRYIDDSIAQADGIRVVLQFRMLIKCV